jgi:transcription initiation factor TFIID TATA-box-binding protein
MGGNAGTPEWSFNIQNIVSTFNCGVQRLNLKKQCLQNIWSQINQEVFAALIGRFEDPKTTLLTFTSGNNVCTGAKSILDSRLACRMALNICQENGVECSLCDLRVQNMVASVDLGYNVRIRSLHMSYPDLTTYDSDVFPGLIFRAPDTKLVFLIFKHGKVVVTGGKDILQMYKQFKYFKDNVLDNFIETSNERADVIDPYTTEYHYYEESSDDEECV